MSDELDQRFLALATHTLANRATQEEQAEFQRLLAADPENVRRFDQIRAELVIAKDILSLIAASEARGPGLSEQQIHRLRAAVDKDLGNPGRRKRGFFISIGGAFFLLVLAAMCPRQRIGPPTVEIAWVDLGVAGTGIGSADKSQETQELRQIKSTFPSAPISIFREESTFELWQSRDPGPGVFRITLEHSGLSRVPEILVHGKTPAGASIIRKFELDSTSTLDSVLREIHLFISTEAR